MSARGPIKHQALQIIRDRGVPIGTILDVGVLTGTPELKTAWPDIKHVLFEPVAEFHEEIKRSYRAIEHELHLVAVGQESGTIALRTRSAFAGMKITHSTMVFHGVTDTPDFRKVPMVTLDEFLRDKTYVEPYLLKIDIDGHELKVIKGAAETLKKCAIVIVECQSSQLVPRLSAMQDAGFVLFDLVEPCYYDKVFWQCDAIFIRRDIATSLFKSLAGTVELGMYENFRGV